MDQIAYALEMAGPMQTFFEEYFEVPYPLPQTSEHIIRCMVLLHCVCMHENSAERCYIFTVHVAVPDFAAGAMENWGLIIYRETALLYDPKSSSAANKQRVAVVVTHELAHMVHHKLTCPSHTFSDD